MPSFKSVRFVSSMLVLCLLIGCSKTGNNIKREYPKSSDQLQEERMGKLTGDGITLFGGKSRRSPGSNGIGVNTYLWRATLDTVYTMPLLSADPFGGTVLTDWYELSGKSNERFKINVLIIGSELRPDAIRVSAFRQIKKGNLWENETVHPALAQEIEEKIIARAREIRFNR